MKTFDCTNDKSLVIPEDEPDHVKGYTRHGFQFVIKRNHWSGALLGYLRVPQGHPWYKSITGKRYLRGNKLAWGRFKKYNCTRREYRGLPWVEVHGGITYADKLCYRGYALRGYWIGFDCAHYGDLVPSMENFGGSYKTLGFVLREIDQLSGQMNQAY